MNQIKINRKDVGKMSNPELAEDYCSLDKIGKLCDERKKEVKEVIVKQDIPSIETTNCELKIIQKKSLSVNIPEFEKVAKKKNLQIGTIIRTITPKDDKKIPRKVLDTLDKYFAIEEILDVKAGDIKSALDMKLISQKEYDSLIETKETIALTPKYVGPSLEI